MKFNSYFVELKSRESNLTGTLIIDGKPISANFKKIGQDVFVAFFTTQVSLKFQENLEFKGRETTSKVLFPLLSKYNKRRLTKMMKIFSNFGEEIGSMKLMLEVLDVDKIMQVSELLDFFSLTPEGILDYLLQMEIEKKIKLIDILNLKITTYENFLNYKEEMHAIFNTFFVNRKKAVNLSEVETNIKLPRSAILFKYLIHTMKDHFSFKVAHEKIIFQKLGLSEKEKSLMDTIESLLKKNRIPVFSIENIIKMSDLQYREVNDSLWNLIESDMVIQLNDKYFMFYEDYLKILNKLKKYKRNQGEMININGMRELTAYSRKFIIALFEYLDTQQITRRVDNEREILLVV